MFDQTVARWGVLRWFVVSVVVCLCLVACHHGNPGTGRLALTSLSSPEAFLVGGFTTRIYQIDDQDNLTLLLLDGTIDDPVQVVTIRMFWKPRAGRTPIDPTATNATIYYTIFTGPDRREVGIYSGAGFVYPMGRPGTDTFNVRVWQATLRLSDRSGGFKDLLGSAVFKGPLAATRDDAAVSMALGRLRVLISQRMGYPRWVVAPPPPAGRTTPPQDS